MCQAGKHMRQTYCCTATQTWCQKGVGSQQHTLAGLAQGKRPGTCCTGCWVGLGASMDGPGKSCPHRGLNPRPSRHQQIPVLSTPSWPPPPSCLIFIIPFYIQTDVDCTHISKLYACVYFLYATLYIVSRLRCGNWFCKIYASPLISREDNLVHL